MKKQKLELTWIGKEVRPKLEPQILLEDPARSYTAAQRVIVLERNASRWSDRRKGSSKSYTK